MSSLLHITNGDCFTSILKELPIKGDIITWREMLCEGKTTIDVGSESFWKTRFDFFYKSYRVSKQTFIDKTLKEYRALCNHKKQDQIVLWFDKDLFCQINMIAVLSWLKTHRPNAQIFVIDNDIKDESGRQMGISELSSDFILSLFENKIELTLDDVEFAEYVWQLYCADNPLRFESLSQLSSTQLSSVVTAMDDHLKRFPSLRNGLNEIENHILKVSNDITFKSKDHLVTSLLKNDNKYGFGDIQFHKIITQLKPMFTSINPVKVSRNGKKALKGEYNCYRLLRNDDYLGGSLKYNFIYNYEDQKLLKL